MSVNGITNVAQSYDNKSAAKTKTNQNQQVVGEEKQKNTESESAVVYEKSEQKAEKKVYQRDTVSIDKLIAEAEKRTQSLRNLVEKMMRKQGKAYDDATDIYTLLREGKLEVDPETRAQAQKDIAEDGYWGVDKTSERMLSFAKALSGGDPSKANEMIDAVKKGFEEATKAWGGELPEISKRTLEATLGKLEAWRDSI
ncbi:MAG: hypothetical protein ACYDEX_10365 [Mobilitalea sp.]